MAGSVLARKILQRQGRLDCRERGLLRATHNLVNLSLARREVAIGRQSTGDVRGVPGILPAYVQQALAALDELLIADRPIQEPGQ